MEVGVMQILSQFAMLEGNAINSAPGEAFRYGTLHVSGSSSFEEQFASQTCDQFGDLESARLMEERYGIKEEGLF